MWFFFLVEKLLKMVYEDKVIGVVYCMFCDFGLDMDILMLGQDFWLRNLVLGVGIFLDICIYSLIWGLLFLDFLRKVEIKVLGVQILYEGVDMVMLVIFSVLFIGV